MNQLTSNRKSIHSPSRPMSSKKKIKLNNSTDNLIEVSNSKLALSAKKYIKKHNFDKSNTDIELSRVYLKRPSTGMRTVCTRNHANRPKSGTYTSLVGPEVTQDSMSKHAERIKFAR